MNGITRMTGINDMTGMTEMTRNDWDGWDD